jgi:transposase
MSLHIEVENKIPAETVKVAKACCGKKNQLVILRDAFGPLFRNQDFSDLYSWKGNEGIAPEILASVTVLQHAEKLSDSQALVMVRTRIDWKYILAVELDYAGFDSSALSAFRERLLENGVSERLFELPLLHMKELGLVKERGKQRTDSTHVLASIRTLNRLELVAETLRHTLNQLAIVAPNWLTQWMPNEWLERYSSRMEEAKFPEDESKRQLLIQTIAEDGMNLLNQLLHPSSPDFLKQLPVVHLLWRLWIEQYEQVNGKIGWREAGNLAPAAQMINSPYDAEARFSRKRNTSWTGYKVHLTESCDEELPHLLTHVETTPATEPDCQTLPTIHSALAKKNLLPAEHLMDAGYVDIDNVLDSLHSHQVEIVGPMRPDSSPQAKQQAGYDIAHFLVDYSTKTVTCPQGKHSVVWSPSTNKAGVQSVTARFAKQDCALCPVMALCTSSKSQVRSLHLQSTQDKHQTLQQARLDQLTPTFEKRYDDRAGIEGTISLAVRSFTLRRARFIGETKTKLQHLAVGSAINFSRLAYWFQGRSRAATRVSSLAALAF